MLIYSHADKYWANQMQKGKLDIVAMDRRYYTAGKEPEIIQFGEMPYLSLEGIGAPGGDLYQQRIGELFTFAYQLKKISGSSGNDFKVPKLECIWSVAAGRDFSRVPMDEWHWKLLIRVPDYISEGEMSITMDSVRKNSRVSNPEGIRIEHISEGEMVQIMHTGPYDKVGESYEKIFAFMKTRKLADTGRYHEIYLSDPSRTAPEKLKTIVRLPVV